MKKLVLIILLAFIFTIPGAAFAEPGNLAEKNHKHDVFRIDSSKLTDKQKSDLLDSYKKVMDAKTEAIRKMVANGALTKEQGDTMLKAIDEKVKYHERNGFSDKPREKANCPDGKCPQLSPQTPKQ